MQNLSYIIKRNYYSHFNKPDNEEISEVIWKKLQDYKYTLQDTAKNIIEQKIFNYILEKIPEVINEEINDDFW